MNPAIGHENKGLYQFGAFRVDARERVLTRDDQRIPLPPKAFDTLLILVENPGHVLSKDQLLKSLWPDSFVEENNLTQQISQLRRALSDGLDGQNYIETVPKLGYRFLPEVHQIGNGHFASTTSQQTEVLWTKRTRTHVVLCEEVEEEETSEPLEFSTYASAQDLPEDGSQTLHIAETPWPVAASQRNRKWILSLAAATTVAVIALAAVLGYRRVERTERDLPSAQLNLIRLTTHGKAQDAAISPDGKYVAYVSGDPGSQSLRLRQIATQSDIEIRPPGQESYGGLTFSHDGGYIFYVGYRTESEVQAASIYRVASMGGEPRKVVQKMESMFTLSPDDQRIAFIRREEPDTNPQLVIAGAEGANSEGGEESVLPPIGGKRTFLAVPSWSPDGRRIAIAVWSDERGTRRLGIRIFDLGAGTQTPLGRQTWTSIDSLVWLPDGKHLVMSANETSSGPAGQIWELSYPSGEFRRLTNDLTDYSDVGVTAASTTLVAVGTNVPSYVWVAPAAHPNTGRQITSGSVGFGGWSGLAWTADRQLVYYSVEGGNQELWMMQADGGHQRRITQSPGWKLQPSACPDGRTILFTVLSGASSEIWRIDRDGSNAKPLSRFPGVEQPICSNDSKWVVFQAAGGKVSRMPIQGGEPLALTTFLSGSPALSPDGKWIACVTFPGKKQLALSVIPFDGGRPVKTISFDSRILPVESAGRLQWTPDGKAIAYADTRDGISNIWIQPLDGGPPQPLTNFPTGQIFSFAWSLDGSRIAITRGEISSDVILLNNFAP